MKQLPNIHDKFFREIFARQEVAKNFLKAYLPEEIAELVDLDTLRIAKDSFVDKELRDHFSDILYTVGFGQSELRIYMLFEHKSYPDPLAGFQLLRYIVRIWELYLKQHPGTETLPPVFSMILYHGKAAWKLPENFQEIVRNDGHVPKEYIPEFRYRLYDFSHIPDEEIRGEVLTRIILLVLKHIFDPDLAEKLPEILSLFREVASRGTALEILEIMLRYVVHAKNFDENEIGQIIRKASVGDEIMQTFIEKYIQQGKTEGIRQGIRQGEVQAGMRLFLKMMAARFGKVPRSVKKKVETADIDTIENWSVRLLQAQTLEEVLKS